MVVNKIEVKPFEMDGFKRLLTEASYSQLTTHVVDQVAYLARYCSWLDAKTVVSEDHYIDRHFLDEHALYYSRNLQPTPTNSVRRFHLFTRQISDKQLSKLFESRAAISGDRAKVERFERNLSDNYLGFISIRPVPSVPVGRTILRCLDDGAPRDMAATSDHDVHLGNLRLRVNGLAFQQQDLAVGACATAALWSALHKVTRFESIRAPTPAEVSQAAARSGLPFGRTLPATAGLSVPQLCDAIRATGFAPEVLNTAEPELFVLALHTYLLSGIPVVLVLGGKHGHHAVTALGFQYTSDGPAPELTTSIPARSARIHKLYLHDDGVGPYARSFLVPRQRTKKNRDALILGIEDRRPDVKTSGNPDPKDLKLWWIDSAIVPVYPKLRLSARSLITLADLVGDAMEAVVGAPMASKLSVEMFYERAGRFLSRLAFVAGADIAKFMRRIALSRWCGIVRWLLDEKPLAEFVYDTTDILRDTQRHGAELIRAVVCLDPVYRPHLENVATGLATVCV